MTFIVTIVFDDVTYWLTKGSKNKPDFAYSGIPQNPDVIRRNWNKEKFIYLLMIFKSFKTKKNVGHFEFHNIFYN